MPPRARKRKAPDADVGSATSYNAATPLSSAAGSSATERSSVDASLASLSSSFLTHTSVLQTQSSANGSGSMRTITKRSQLSAREKLAVVEWYYAHGKNQQATSAHFKALPGYEKLSQSSVSRYITAEPKIRALVESGRANVVRVNSVRNPDFENVLVAWLDRMGNGAADCARLSGDLIKQTAAKVYDHLETPDAQRLELSNGWLRAFQFRHGLKGVKPRRSVGSASDAIATTTSPSTRPGSTDPNEPVESTEPNEPMRYTSTTAAAVMVTPSQRHRRAMVLPQQLVSAATTTSTASIATARHVPAATAAASVQQPRSQQPQHEPFANVSDQVLKREQERVALVIRDFLSWDHRRSLRDVWTFDELVLQYARLPYGSLSSGSAGSESGTEPHQHREPSLTVALATNADGSERSEPLIIGRTERPRSFKHNRSGSALGFQYVHNRGAWLTADIFVAWLEAWSAQLGAQQRHVLLLVDSFAGHKLGAHTVAHIQLEYFNARVTELVQPFCDPVGGITRAFKAAFRRLVVLRAADTLLSNGSSDGGSRLDRLDQLAAMDLVVCAWPLVASDTIARCWRNARILPMDQASSRTDVRPRALALPEVTALQRAIEVLDAEARASGQAVVSFDAAAYVDVESAASASDDPSRLEDLVQFAVGSRDGSLADGSLADGSSETDDDSDCGTAELTPTSVYRSLMVLEQFWREQPLHLSDDVRKLLQLTRSELQSAIARTRGQQQEQHQTGGALSQQSQQQMQQQSMARGRRK